MLAMWVLAEDGGLPTSNSCAKSFWRRALVADVMLVYGVCLGGLKNYGLCLGGLEKDGYHRIHC